MATAGERARGPVRARSRSRCRARLGSSSRTSATGARPYEQPDRAAQPRARLVIHKDNNQQPDVNQMSPSKPGWQWLLPRDEPLTRPSRSRRRRRRKSRRRSRRSRSSSRAPAEQEPSSTGSPSLRRTKVLAQTRNALVLAAGERRGAVLESLKETMSARRTPRLGDDGPFREPDRSSARNDGRARAVAAGELRRRL